MAYFAVLNEVQSDVSVKKLHINLWMLGRVREEVICDIGLCLQASAGKQVRALRLALPFRAESATDLRPKLLDQRTSSLVFGEPAEVKEINQRKQVSYGQSVHRLTSVSCSQGDERLCGDAHSVWELDFDRPIADDAESYVRIRFKIKAIHRTWSKDRGGRLLDLRVSDIRDGLALNQWDGVSEQVVPIESLNAFVIVSTYYKLRTAHPLLSYVRFLEGAPWNDYLDLPKKSSWSKKWAVYHWKVDQKQVTKEHPFRGFLDLAPETAPLGKRTLALQGIVAIGLFHGTAAAWQQAPAVWSFVTGSLWHSLIVIVPAVIAIIAAARNLEWLKDKILGHK